MFIRYSLITNNLIKLMKRIKITTLTVLLGILTSCQKEEITVDQEAPEVSASGSNIEFRKLMGNEVPVLKQDDGTFLIGGEGSDMVAFESNFDNPNASGELTPQLPGRSALVIGGTGRVRKWPNNLVVYSVGNLTKEMKTNFQLAINEWESKTAIRFKERTKENDYVTVARTGDNCFCGIATIGQARDRGFLRFGSRAPLSVIIHEIGHTLGFLHEQNRADRDDFMKINFENISKNAEREFFKAENSIPLTEELDLNSIMMYGSYTFSKNGKPTIVDLKGNAIPRSSGRLSAGDISGTNQAYPPTDTDTDTNTGVTNPDTKTIVTICDDVSEFNRGTRYKVGDKVTYRGFLYQRDFSRFVLLGSCDEVQSNDICSGVSSYISRNSYQTGDKVTFRGDLYKKVVNGWVKEGQCGS